MNLCCCCPGLLRARHSRKEHSNNLSSSQRVILAFAKEMETVNAVKSLLRSCRLSFLN